MPTVRQRGQPGRAWVKAKVVPIMTIMSTTYARYFNPFQNSEAKVPFNHKG